MIEFKKFPVIILLAFLSINSVQAFGPEINLRPVFYNTGISDTAIINDILQEKANPDSLSYYRNICYSIFQKNKNNKAALLAFGMSSEYLADYDLAAKAYGMFLTKTDKLKEKALYTKFRAHQVSCKFLSQSQKRKPGFKKDESPENIGAGYFGIGVEFDILDKHLVVTNVLEGYPAYNSVIKSFDEIIAIDSVLLTESCSGYLLAKKSIGDTKKSVAKYTIKSFGENKAYDIILERVFIPEQSTDVVAQIQINESPVEKVPDSPFEKKLESKNNFLNNIIVAIRSDSGFSKNIETVRKINYAVSLLNKWAEAPVKEKFFHHLDQQLGMIVSIVNLTRVNNVKIISNDGDSIVINPTEFKELASNDFAKKERTKFESTAQSMPEDETKIDDNITFVKKNNYDAYSGYYECVENSFYAQYANKSERLKFETCPQGESPRRFRVADDSPCEQEIQVSYTKIDIKENQVYMSSKRETKFLPCSSNYSNQGAYHKSTSPGGYIKISSESNGEIDFTTMKCILNSETKNDVNMGQTTVTYGYGGNSTTSQLPTEGAKATSMHNQNAVTIEFLKDYLIKFTDIESGQWQLLKKVKDL